MATYTVRSRSTMALTGVTGAALSKEAAINAVLAGITGPTGREVHIWSSEQLSASGPTGVYATTLNVTHPLTGATFSATGREAAIELARLAGPTGTYAGIDIWSADA